MPRLKRVRDWRARLSDLIEDRRRVPYSDVNNCGMFLFDCINVMTGVDLGEPFRGKFTTLAKAFVLLRQIGHDDVCSYLASELEEIPPVMARAGDVMAFMVEEGWACGIVNGERVTVLGMAGLGTIPRDDALRAFRI